MAPGRHSHDLLFALLLLLSLLNVSAPSSYHQNINALDLAALAAIKNSLTDIPGSNFFSTWDFSSPDPCSSFTGVTCSPDNRVTTLSLGTGLFDSPGLAGSLSPALASLTELTQLLLFPGLVTGPIPPQLGRLTNLRVISLTNNRLRGPIPSSFSSLSNLHTLDLSYNQLSGSIPLGLTKLPLLRVLVLASNKLSGGISTTVTTQLLHLDLKKNKLSGPLPASLPSSLRYLSASGNSLEGPLNGLESLPELVFLDLSMNQFSGPIPNSLFNPTLSSMFLQRNNLSGRVPPRGPMNPTYAEGSIVDLSHNMLTGELSAVLAGVETLFLNNNRLVGSVPKEYVEGVRRGTTKTLYLQHNYLSGFPVERGFALPDTAMLCLSYNCMVPPVGTLGCPASAGEQLSRPMSQCSVFNHHSSTD